MDRPILLAVLFAVVVGCTDTKTLNVPIRNASGTQLNPRIVELDGHGNTLQSQSLGTLSPTTQPTAQVTAVLSKVQPGDSVQVLADIPTGYQVFESGQTTVASGGSKFVTLPQVDLLMGAATLPSDDQAIQQLSSAASEIGDVFDNLNTAALADAASHYWGALLVITPMVRDPKTQQIIKHRHILYEVPSSLFSTPQAPDVNFPGTNWSADVDLSGKAAASFNAQFPVFGGGGLSINSSDVYKLHWQLDNAGWLVRNDPPSFNPLDRLTQLSDDTKKQIFSYIQSDPDAMLMYVSQIFAVKGGSETVTEGQSVAVGSKLNAGSVVTASGAYNFDSSRSQSVTIPSLLLDLDGIPFKPAFVQIAGDNPGKPVTNPTAAALYSNDIAIFPKAVSAPSATSSNPVTLAVPTVADLKASIEKRNNEAASPAGATVHEAPK